MIVGLPLLEQLHATIVFASNIISIPHNIAVTINDSESQIPKNTSNIIQACIKTAYPVEILGQVSLHDHLTINCPGVSIAMPKVRILPGNVTFPIQIQNDGEQELILKKD